MPFPFPKVPSPLDLILTGIKGGNWLSEKIFGKDIVSEEQEQKALKEEQTKNATKKPPKGKQYDGGRPKTTKPKDKPKDKGDEDGIKVDVTYKLPPKTNQQSFPDPLLIPKKLIKFIRAISGQSATQQKYGELDIWPQIFTPVTFNYTADIIGTGRRQAHLEEGLKKYMAWFTKDLKAEEDEKNGIDLDPDSEDISNFWDQAALISPEVPGDFVSPINMIFGQQAIWDEIADTVASGSNAYIGGLRGIVWMGDINFVVRPSGTTDLSDRIPAAGFEFFENVSHGDTQRALGVGEKIFIPTHITEHTKEELLAQIAAEEEILNSGNYSEEIVEERMEELRREKADIGEGGHGFKKIKSIPDLAIGISNLFAELMGAFPIRIVVEKGSFLNKRVVNSGDKSTIEDLPEQNFNLPNIAEALAEITNTQILTASAITLHSEMLQRMIAEICSIKSATIDTYDQADLIVDYLGIPIEHIKQKYRLCFDPFIATDESFENIYQILLGKEIEYKKPIFKVGKSNPTLAAQLSYLMKSGQIIHGAFYHEYKQEDGGLKYYLSQLKKGHDVIKNFNGVTEEGKPSRLSFEEWLKIVIEEGASDYTGEEDSKTPYDQPWDERPLTWIRETRSLDKNTTYGSLD